MVERERPTGRRGHGLGLSGEGDAVWPGGDPFAQRLSPMLPGYRSEPFDSPHHVFEVLWDGVRALALVEGKTVRFQGRYGADLTPLFPELGDVAGRVRGPAVLDGVIVAVDGQGRPNFRPLARRLAGVSAGAGETAASEGAELMYHAFDVIHCGGRWRTGLTLVRRKEVLAGAVAPGGRLAVPDFVAGDGVALYEAARAFGLEGIVAKDLRSPYLPGQRSEWWLAIRSGRCGQFVIGGYTYGGPWKGRRAARAQGPFASLLLGLFDSGGELRFVGEVTGGFGEAAGAIAARLEPLTGRRCPFASEPPIGRLVFWCRPELAARVRFAGWDARGRLRFPVFEALRPDVPAEACRWEEALG